MIIKVSRYSETKESTLGLLYINGTFECYTLENPYQEKKVWGNTRIPPNTYSVELRTIGELNEKYKKKFGNSHKGMLWLRNVKDFSFVYLHIGNTSKETNGCVLVGSGANNNQTENGFITNSTKAYKKLYALVVEEISKGNNVEIEIRDINFA